MTVSSRAFMQIAVHAAEEKKAQNIVALNLENVSLVADYFVICHGNSDVQVQSIVTEVRKRVEEAGGRMRGVEGMDTARWVLMDLGDVVVHVFHREEREYYNIERLWSDAKVEEFA
ncbi:ribosome silencing factor [Paenibacillus sp. IB182496]|uniref:Ribosomal silencing factor RsfS n=1 Tax=Paenibacillus sabuli TaxID=2772509 RepID=A0A927BRC8_9BACL|nr:ribosome silencing factor [Paenibacillus sabuli]MBD2844491.1 ribosome silencing factor [Paenibacillus sabuli]